MDELDNTEMQVTAQNGQAERSGTAVQPNSEGEGQPAELVSTPELPGAVRAASSQGEEDVRREAGIEESSRAWTGGREDGLDSGSSKGEEDEDAEKDDLEAWRSKLVVGEKYEQAEEALAEACTRVLGTMSDMHTAINDLLSWRDALAATLDLPTNALARLTVVASQMMRSKGVLGEQLAALQVVCRAFFPSTWLHEMSALHALQDSANEEIERWVQQTQKANERCARYRQEMSLTLKWYHFAAALRAKSARQAATAASRKLRLKVDELQQKLRVAKAAWGWEKRRADRAFTALHGNTRRLQKGNPQQEDQDLTRSSLGPSGSISDRRLDGDLLDAFPLAVADLASLVKEAQHPHSPGPPSSPPALRLTAVLEHHKTSPDLQWWDPGKAKASRGGKSRAKKQPESAEAGALVENEAGEGTSVFLSPEVAAPLASPKRRPGVPLLKLPPNTIPPVDPLLLTQRKGGEVSASSRAAADERLAQALGLENADADSAEPGSPSTSANELLFGPVSCPPSCLGEALRDVYTRREMLAFRVEHSRQLQHLQTCFEERIRMLHAFYEDLITKSAVQKQPLIPPPPNPTLDLEHLNPASRLTTAATARTPRRRSKGTPPNTQRLPNIPQVARV